MNSHFRIQDQLNSRGLCLLDVLSLVKRPPRVERQRVPFSIPPLLRSLNLLQRAQRRRRADEARAALKRVAEREATFSRLLLNVLHRSLHARQQREGGGEEEDHLERDGSEGELRGVEGGEGVGVGEVQMEEELWGP